MPSIFKTILLVSGLFLSVQSAADVEAEIQFPASNPFGRVNNGVSTNMLQVRVQNHGTEPITISRIFGSYYDTGPREKALMNTTTLPLRFVVKPLAKSQVIPYRFYSENKIGEVGLKVWVEYIDSGNKEYIVLGYEGAVTVIEPKGSWFDIKLLSIYIIILAGMGLTGYAFNQSYVVPAIKKANSSKPKSERVRKSLATTSFKPQVNPETGKVESFDSEWIPENLLPKGKKNGEGNTSGSESEGARKRK